MLRMSAPTCAALAKLAGFDAVTSVHRGDVINARKQATDAARWYNRSRDETRGR